VKSDVETVLDCYVCLYFACHTRSLTASKKRYAISPNQANVLEYLDTEKGTTVLALACHLRIAPSTMSLTLDRLQRGDSSLCEKNPTDGRRTIILITAEGDSIKRNKRILEPDLIAAMLNRTAATRRRSRQHRNISKPLPPGIKMKYIDG